VKGFWEPFSGVVWHWPQRVNALYKPYGETCRETWGNVRSDIRDGFPLKDFIGNLGIGPLGPMPKKGCQGPQRKI
jgi:hypothetical protein